MLKNLFGSGSSNGRGNDFVGQYVELGKQKLRIRRVLGEGKIILEICNLLITLKLYEQFFCFALS